MPSVLDQVLYLIEHKHIQTVKMDQVVQTILQMEEKGYLPSGHHTSAVSIPFEDIRTHWKEFDAHLAQMLGHGPESDPVIDGLENAFDELTFVDELIIATVHQETQKVKEAVLETAFDNVSRYTRSPFHDTSEAYSRLNEIESGLREDKIVYEAGTPIYSTVAKDASEAVDEALNDLDTWMPKVRDAKNRVRPVSGWQRWMLYGAIAAILVAIIFGMLQVV